LLIVALSLLSVLSFSPKEEHEMKVLLATALALMIGLLVFAEAPTLHGCFLELYQHLVACNDFEEGPLQDACILGALQGYDKCLDMAAKPPTSKLYGWTKISVNLSRAKGKPRTETFPISVPVSGDYYVNVFNGDEADLSTRVTSATLSLSPNVNLFSPSDFKKDIHVMVKPIHLDAGSYTLMSELRSKPGSFLLIIICDRDLSEINE
jgi:hypothetical protein